MDGFTLLTGLCYVTALVAPALNLPATIRSWKTGILGQGGRGGRGGRAGLDSIVAALLGNAVWFAYGWITGSGDPLCINAWAGLCQVIYLGTFFVLCSANERRGALKRVAIAALYLALTVRVGLKRFDDAADELHRQELHKLLCTCASLVAGSMPFFVAHIMTETKTLDMLPIWPISAFGTINGVMWAIRAIHIWNIYLATMNVVTALSSSMMVALVAKWDKPEPVPGHTITSDERTPLLSGGNTSSSSTGNTRVSSGDKGKGSNGNSHNDKKIEPSADKGKEPVIHESHGLDLEAGGSGTSQATDGTLNDTSPAPAAVTVPSPSAED